MHAAGVGLVVKFAPGVGREDDCRVVEAYVPLMESVLQCAAVQELQEQVDRVKMRLLDLVE